MKINKKQTAHSFNALCPRMKHWFRDQEDEKVFKPREKEDEQSKNSVKLELSTEQGIKKRAHTPLC